MPISNYDQYFGGEAGSAQKAYDAMVKEYGEEKGKSVFYASVNKKKGKKVSKTSHGPLFDDFTARATHPHNGSYYDTFKPVAEGEGGHGGRLYDEFETREPTNAHGERWDRFEWKAMPALHGTRFDEGFSKPAAMSGRHGSWFDAFKGGAMVRLVVNGSDFEGKVIDVNEEFATVQGRNGQTVEAAFEQFLAYASPNMHQASPPVNVELSPGRPAPREDVDLEPMEHTFIHTGKSFTELLEVAKLYTVGPGEDPGGEPTNVQNHEGKTIGHVQPWAGKHFAYHHELGFQGSHNTHEQAVAAIQNAHYTPPGSPPGGYGADTTGVHRAAMPAAMRGIGKTVADRFEGTIHQGFDRPNTPSYAAGKSHVAVCNTPACQTTAAKTFGEPQSQLVTKMSGGPVSAAHQHQGKCAVCGREMSWTHQVAKVQQSALDVLKAIDSTETAIQGEASAANQSFPWCPYCQHTCRKVQDGKCPTCGRRVMAHGGDRGSGEPKGTAMDWSKELGELIANVAKNTGLDLDVLKSKFDQMVAKLKAQHPDWSEERCRRVAASIGRQKYGAAAMAKGAAHGKAASHYAKTLHEAAMIEKLSSKGTDVPERSHPDTDHHMHFGEDADRTRYCPHCGEALDAVDYQTEQGQPRRKRISGQDRLDSAATHKCLGSSIATLQKVIA